LDNDSHIYVVVCSRLGWRIYAYCEVGNVRLGGFIMSDTPSKSVEEVARELVEVLPKKGGCREGMYHDILHALTTLRTEKALQIQELKKEIKELKEALDLYDR